MRINRFGMVGFFVSVLSVMAHGSALAQQVNPQDFGIVEAPGTLSCQTFVEVRILDVTFL